MPYSIMDMQAFISNLRKVALWDSLRASSRYAKCGDCGVGELRSTIPCYRNYCEAYNSDDSPFPEVAVTDQEIKSCREFDEALDKAHWMKRSTESLDEAKVSSDNVNGKIGEFIVMHTLRGLGFQTGEPDLGIYDRSHKSFDADLRFEMDGIQYGASIKTFRISQGLPSRVSWVMQYSDLGRDSGTDRHFFDPDASLRENLWFAGVALSPDMRHGRMLAFIPMQLLYEAGIYAPLELRKFDGIKKAVYWDDARRLGAFNRIK